MTPEPYGFTLLQRYPEAWQLFLQVFFATNLLIGFLYSLAKQKKIMMPKVRDRDVHTSPKPRIGGTAMWFVVLVSLVTLAVGKHADLLNFQGPHILGIDRALWGILVAMVIILAFGIIDDLFSLSPRAQLGGQFLAATALIIGGVGVAYIRLPFGGTLHLDTILIHMPTWLGSASVGLWSALFTYIWVITMINVMNFFDGLDGLAGSVAMTSSLVLLLVSLRLGFFGAATLCLVVFGITAGFLPWNWNPSKLFMGTVGSQLLGMLLAIIAIISGAKVATAILVLGIPLFDAIIVIIRRLLAHQSPFKADQRHLHHRLLKIGLPTPGVVILINVVVLVFGILALRTQQTNTKGALTIALAICMALLVLITYLLERRASSRVK
jgi:UDP-GlcNAc:undecaprenyl-phosphate GlcNAc-1-phosphate transferase